MRTTAAANMFGPGSVEVSHSSIGNLNNVVNIAFAAISPASA
jgi:hypothetical protein